MVGSLRQIGNFAISSYSCGTEETLPFQERIRTQESHHLKQGWPSSITCATNGTGSCVHAREGTRSTETDRAESRAADQAGEGI